MSPFIVLPVVAGVLWLVHAGLGVGGHRAYRYTRWVLFGGLAVTALVFFLLGVQASRSVPPEWKDDSLAGVLAAVLALETLLVMLALALLEVVHAGVTQTIEDTRTRAGSERSDEPNP
ncbi:hypothetical protein CXX84_05925 [Arthrobacter sp. AFG7.2]|uniref:hypothetical protein n=1 Tax=Arthrobacter sp. AFG7.2 TaxID=1688693 RepID=UPI000C9E3094|nr:hypothetical protein [Arthrobacter sp. AFG7.2]PNI09764.1 hypothetical protein CXX84_05925 [Arthrobacter sp. AFG7.2]